MRILGMTGFKTSLRSFAVPFISQLPNLRILDLFENACLFRLTITMCLNFLRD